MPSFRRRRKGTEPATVVVEPGAAADPVPTTEDILLDLRDPLPAGPLEWGVPTRCPQCDDMGYIDRLDLLNRVMQLHCPTCHFHWEITEAQIEAVNARSSSGVEQSS